MKKQTNNDTKLHLHNIPKDHAETVSGYVGDKLFTNINSGQTNTIYSKKHELLH